MTAAPRPWRQRVLELVRAGVVPEMPRVLAKQITVTNGYSLTMIALIQPYMVVFYLLGSPLLAAPLPVVTLLLCAPLALNRRGHHRAARLVMLAVANAAALAYSLMLGPETGFHLFFLPLACCPFVVFDLGQWRSLGSGAALSVVGAVLALGLDAEAVRVFAPSPALARGLYVGCLCASLLMMIAVVSYSHMAQLRAERDLESMHLGIERELEARYQKLVAERREIEAQLRLTDRLASVGTLAAGVAHEINNPLTFVSLNLELVRRIAREDDSLDRAARDRIRRALDSAGEGVERVAVIVRDLKTFARGDQATRTTVDVREVVRSALGLARRTFDQRVSVVEDLASAPPVHANEARLGQVFLNLLLNAAQAVAASDDERDHRIAIETRASSDGDATVVVIEDDGPGIDDDAIARVFDPFFTTKPEGLGTGLGLYICRRIIDELGGELAVHSGPGAGARFTVTLPAASVGVTAPRTSRAPTARPLPALRVLVIDDEREVGSALAPLLAPCEVASAHDAGAASAALAATDYDLVLCDVVLPGASGIELFDRTRAVAPGLADRFVFMTGGALSAEQAEALARTGRPLLHKPLSVGELRAQVRLADAELGPSAEGAARLGAVEPTPGRSAAERPE